MTEVPAIGLPSADRCGLGGPEVLPLSAFVLADGSIESASTAGAAGYLNANRALVDYARALPGSGSLLARFLWLDHCHGWVHVSLNSGPKGTGTVITLAAAPLPARLTARELDVLTLMAGGLTNHQIAARLVVSSRTVSTHVEHILGKLGETTRAGAAGVAVDRGYLRLPLPGVGTPVRALTKGLTIGFLNASAEGRAPQGPSGQPTWAGRPRQHSVPARPGSHHAARTGPGERAEILGRSRALAGRRPLVIGSAFPKRGPAADDGRQMANGSALAIAEINARGGIGGRRIEQIVVDIDIFSASGVRLAFEQLFAAGVDAITSGYVFAEDAARELAAGYPAPYLHATTSQAQAEIVADNPIHYKGIFQVCPTELHYGPGFIRFLNDLRTSGRWRPPSSRLVFVDTPLPSAQMVNQLTLELAGRSGWEITAVETVPAVGAEWLRVADRISRSDPAAIMISQFLAAELAGFQLRIVQRVPQALVYAVYAPSVPEFLALTGPAAEGMLWATVTGTYGDHLGQRFGRDYATAFGRPAGRSHAGIAYDEVCLLAQAWMAVPHPARLPAVARELRRIRYRGVNGSYYLDNAAQCGLSFPDATPDPSLGQAHLVFQIQDGANRIISPPLYAEASFR